MKYEIEYEKVYRYCYFRLGNQEMAEDTTQEAFLRYFESQSYQERGQMLQYIYTIARNLCNDAFRKPPPEQMEEAHEPITDLCDNNYIRRITLRYALDHLTAYERELVLLRYVNEEPASSLAKIYGVSRYAIHRQLKSILKKLRNYMECNEGGEQNHG